MTADPGRPLRLDLHTHMLPPQLPDMRARSGHGGWISLLGQSSAQSV